MTRSLGPTLPESVRQVLAGTDLERHVGATFLLVSNDPSGWPHLALLSAGEIVALDAHTLRAGLWLHSTTTGNLERTGRGLLAVVADGNGYYVRVSARRAADLDLGPDGRLAQFALAIQEVLEDAADYATLTSGVTFTLHEPAQVLPRWARTVAALLGQSTAPCSD